MSGKKKYLGIYLTANWKDLYKTDYIPLINDIKEEIRKILRRSLSWVGLINIIKMGVVPKVLYKFQMLPIQIPQSFLTFKKKSSWGLYGNIKKQEYNIKF